MSENTQTEPIEATVVSRATPVETSEIPPMSKTEAGVLVLLIGGVMTAVGFAIRADIKNQEKYAAELKVEREERDAKAEATRKARTAWFDEQRKNGMRVLELRDGSYIAVSNEAYSKAEVKKKGQWL